MHGPLLPKNPKLCDYLIQQALKRKYGHDVTLLPLDDVIEQNAHDCMVQRILEG